MFFVISFKLVILPDVTFGILSHYNIGQVSFSTMYMQYDAVI